MNTKMMLSKDEDILLILDELAEVKDSFKQLSQQLQRIERRVSAALPRQAQPAKQVRRPIDLSGVPQLVERLKEMVSRGEEIEKRLNSYSVKPELQRIASELGMTNTKLPPKDDLIRRIAARLRQSASVTSSIRDAG